MIDYSSLKPRILATDLDNTIVSEQVSHSILWDTISLDDTSLIYITGRHKHSSLQLIEEEQLPIPDVLICDVGASIYAGPDFIVDQEWNRKTPVEDFNKVRAITSALKLEQQPIESSRRLAFFATPQQVESLRARISAEQINVEVIYSSERDVDILPKYVNKGAALTYVLEKGKYKGEVVVAGDSENDLSLFQLGFTSIAVGNSCEAIRNLKDKKHIYFANQHAAAGIKEAWEKFHP